VAIVVDDRLRVELVSAHDEPRGTEWSLADDRADDTVDGHLDSREATRGLEKETVANGAAARQRCRRGDASSQEMPASGHVSDGGQISVF
jgi:hypothetical protein